MTNGTTYTCSARAFNAVGAGSESSGATVRIGAPAAPSSVTNAPGSANGSIKVTWTAAKTPSGAPLTGHAVTCAASGSTKTGNANGSARNLTLTGLTRTKTYTCKVSAKNKFGTGPAKSSTAGTRPK